MCLYPLCPVSLTPRSCTPGTGVSCVWYCMFQTSCASLPLHSYVPVPPGPLCVSHRRLIPFGSYTLTSVPLMSGTPVLLCTLSPVPLTFRTPVSSSLVQSGSVCH